MRGVTKREPEREEWFVEISHWENDEALITQGQARRDDRPYELVQTNFRSHLFPLPSSLRNIHTLSPSKASSTELLPHLMFIP
jgi:hypothetical protein